MEKNEKYLSDITARGSCCLQDLAQSLGSQWNGILHAYINGDWDYALNIQTQHFLHIEGKLWIALDKFY